MIYFMLATIVVTAVGLLTYTLLFERKYFFGLLVAVVICSGFLSFYVFFYIGSYTSTAEDIILNANLVELSDKNYKLIIDGQWKKKPEIFGFDGSHDILAIRYNPKACQVLSSDMELKECDLGSTALKLSDEYRYSKISKSQQELYCSIKDGNDVNVNIVLKQLNSGGEIRVFYIHDYKIPLNGSVYWEREEIVRLE